MLSCTPLANALLADFSFWRAIWLKSSVKGVMESIFERMLSWSLKDALQYSLSKCSPHQMLFSWRAFFWESILPTNIGEHFWESKRAFLQNRLLPGLQVGLDGMSLLGPGTHGVHWWCLLLNEGWDANVGKDRERKKSKYIFQEMDQNLCHGGLKVWILNHIPKSIS